MARMLDQLYDALRAQNPSAKARAAAEKVATMVDSLIMAVRGVVALKGQILQRLPS